MVYIQHTIIQEVEARGSEVPSAKATYNKSGSKGEIKIGKEGEVNIQRNEKRNHADECRSNDEVPHMSEASQHDKYRRDSATGHPGIHPTTIHSNSRRLPTNSGAAAMDSGVTSKQLRDRR